MYTYIYIYTHTFIYMFKQSSQFKKKNPKKTCKSIEAFHFKESLIHRVFYPKSTLCKQYCI